MNTYIAISLAQALLTTKFSKICLFLIGSFCLVSTTSANPTYKVFFDGGGIHAGSIVATGGADPVPSGVCGMRINGADLLAFYWAEYSGSNLGSPMSEAPFGPPSDATYDFPDEALEDVIRFTGPLGDNCEDEWVFHLPLAGAWPVFANGTPSGAGALVFQTIDVEWLDAGFQVWEPIDDGPGSQEDPEFPSFCEVWPDACIENPGFAVDSPCNSSFWSDLCGAAKGLDHLASGIKQQVQVVIKALNIKGVVSAQEIAGRLIRAKRAAVLALENAERLNFSHIKVVTPKILDDANARIGVTRVASQACVSAIEKTQSALINGTEKTLSSEFFVHSMHDATHKCKAVVIGLAQVKDQLQQMPNHFISTNER